MSLKEQAHQLSRAVIYSHSLSWKRAVSRKSSLPMVLAFLPISLELVVQGLGADA